MRKTSSLALRLPGRRSRRMEPMAKAKRVRRQRAAAEAAEAGGRKPPPVGGQKRPPSTWAWVALALGIAGVVRRRPHPREPLRGRRRAEAARCPPAASCVRRRGRAALERRPAGRRRARRPGCAGDARRVRRPPVPVLRAVGDRGVPGLRRRVRPRREAPDRVPAAHLHRRGLGPRGARLARRGREAGQGSGTSIELMYRNQGSENSGWVSDDFVAALGRSIPGLDVEQWLARRGYGRGRAGDRRRRRPRRSGRGSTRRRRS